jgi:hypothetical protein
MAKAIERLTSAKVRHERRPGIYPDGGGLYLQVTESKTSDQINKSWLFRFARGAKERRMGLGSLYTRGLQVQCDYPKTAFNVFLQTTAGEKGEANTALRTLIEGLGCNVSLNHDCAASIKSCEDGK